MCGATFCSSSIRAAHVIHAFGLMRRAGIPIPLMKVDNNTEHASTAQSMVVMFPADLCHCPHHPVVLLPSGRHAEALSTHSLAACNPNLLFLHSHVNTTVESWFDNATAKATTVCCRDAFVDQVALLFPVNCGVPLSGNCLPLSLLASSLISAHSPQHSAQVTLCTCQQSTSLWL